MKEQIEEMADILCQSKNHVCNGGDDCRCLKQATDLYNAGYRKQSNGEWKISKIGDGGKVRTCSNCHISQTVNVYNGKVMFKYCPYCGAKMKGGNDMKRCQHCIHYNICSIWSTTDLDKDEAYKYCYGNFKDIADVVPKSEVAMEIIEDIRGSIRANAKVGLTPAIILVAVENKLLALQKKYTEGKT